MRRFLLARPARRNRPARSLDIVIRADSPEAAVRASSRFVVGPVIALEIDEEDRFLRTTDAIDRVFADAREAVQS